MFYNISGYKKFKDGLTRIAVVSGEKAGRGLELYADPSIGNVAQRVLLVLDFSFSLEDLMSHVGAINCFGQKTAPEIHLLGDGSFPSDQLRFMQFMNYLRDLGATCELRPRDIADGLYTAAGLYATLKAIDTVSQKDISIHDWLKIVGSGFKIGPNEELYDTKKMTFSSQAATSAFLSRCLRLPLHVQKQLMNEICQLVQLRMQDVETFGSHRGILSNENQSMNFFIRYV